MTKVYLIPKTISLEAIRSLEASDGTRVSIIEDADGNNVISTEVATKEEFREVRNMMNIAGHKFELIDYKPKTDYPKTPEEEQ